MKNYKKLLIITGVLVALGYGSFEFFALRERALQTGVNNNPQTNAVYQQVSNFKYKGENGVDALTLLKSKTSVEQDRSGLVVVINGRKADSGKKEFWAFYVNGKLAEKGPVDYITGSDDVIEWKIETY